MNARFFLDTNILVYTFDLSAPEKCRRGRELVGLALQGRGCISWQVVQEFCHVAQRRFLKPIDRAALGEYQQQVLFPLCKVWPDETLYQDTLTIQADTGFSWYDSLLVAAAVRSGCPCLYTEDLQHDRRYRGVRIIDPFR